MDADITATCNMFPSTLLAHLGKDHRALQTTLRVSAMAFSDFVEAFGWTALRIGGICVFIAFVYAIGAIFYGLTVFAEKFGWLACIGLLLGIATAFILLGFAVLLGYERRQAITAATGNAFERVCAIFIHRTSSATYAMTASSDHPNTQGASLPDDHRSTDDITLVDSFFSPKISERGTMV